MKNNQLTKQPSEQKPENQIQFLSRCISNFYLRALPGLWGAETIRADSPPFVKAWQTLD